MLTHGLRTEASSGPGQPATTEQTHNRPLLKRYDLNPGEGFEQSYEHVDLLGHWLATKPRSPGRDFLALMVPWTRWFSIH